MEETARGTDIRRCGETIWDTVAAIRDGDEVRGREGARRSGIGIGSE